MTIEKPAQPFNGSAAARSSSRPRSSDADGDLFRAEKEARAAVVAPSLFYTPRGIWRVLLCTHVHLQSTTFLGFRPSVMHPRRGQSVGENQINKEGGGWRWIYVASAHYAFGKLFAAV